MMQSVKYVPLANSMHSHMHNAQNKPHCHSVPGLLDSDSEKLLVTVELSAISQSGSLAPKPWTMQFSSPLVFFSLLCAVVQHSTFIQKPFFFLHAELFSLCEELNYKVQLTLSFSLVKSLLQYLLSWQWVQTGLLNLSEVLHMTCQAPSSHFLCLRGFFSSQRWNLSLRV